MFVLSSSDEVEEDGVEEDGVEGDGVVRRDVRVGR